MSLGHGPSLATPFAAATCGSVERGAPTRCATFRLSANPVATASGPAEDAEDAADQPRYARAGNEVLTSTRVDEPGGDPVAVTGIGREGTRGLEAEHVVEAIGLQAPVEGYRLERTGLAGHKAPATGELLPRAARRRRS